MCRDTSDDSSYVSDERNIFLILHSRASVLNINAFSWMDTQRISSDLRIPDKNWRTFETKNSSVKDMFARGLARLENSPVTESA